MSVLSSFIPLPAADIFSILAEDEQDSSQQFFGFDLQSNDTIFEDARPMRATISEPAQFMTHPLEDGAITTDHRIVLPVEISIVFVLRSRSYRQTFQRIRQAFLDATKFSVQTKAATYENMYIADMPHEEDPATFDTITLIVVFREVQFFQVELLELTSDVVTDPGDVSTTQRGEQTPRGPNESLLARGVRALQDYFQ